VSILRTASRSPTRAWAGLGLGVAGLVAVTAGLTTSRSGSSLTSAALLYLVPVVVVAVVGGVWLGLTVAVASDALLNWFFVPPYHTFTVENRENVLALLVYVLVGVTVSVTVDLAARQRAAAVRSGVEARLLARITAEPVVDQSLTRLLGHVRETFGMRRVALVEGDVVVASVGGELTGEPTLAVEAAEGLRLVAEGPELFAEDRRLLGRLAAAAARTLEAQRMARRAAEAEQLAEIDRLRTAILAAVGHDLRTPLASIKAAVSSLRAPDVAFSPEDRDELLATVEESGDRLDDLVENLLDMSRLQAGVLSVQPRAVALDEVVARAVLRAPVRVAFGDDLPLVYADPGLLERVVANLVSNAVRASTEVAVGAVATPSTVELRVVDHGSGVPSGERDRIFAPFQRLDDRTADGGLGLGLAIARGFTEAMGGRLTPGDTPGGGLTMTVTLPRAVSG
jgi:K+-sensing histidine kinase KdpD